MYRLIFALISFAALALIGCTGMPPATYGSGWTTLLDGPRGFDENWTRIGDANWRIVDGIAQADAGKKGESSYLMTKQAYSDFMLRAEFWVSDDANSGIYMRCPDLNNITYRNCTEANIFDQRPDPTYATGGINHLSQIKDSSFAKAMFVSLNAFSVSFTNSAARAVVGTHAPRTNNL